MNLFYLDVALEGVNALRTAEMLMEEEFILY